jgi:hypothetical protein
MSLPAHDPVERLRADREHHLALSEYDSDSLLTAQVEQAAIDEILRLREALSTLRRKVYDRSRRSGTQ